MLTIHDQKVDQKQFPDGTALLSLATLSLPDDSSSPVQLAWYYENDAEFFSLAALSDQLKELGYMHQTLLLPYIPHARMDRIHEGDVFTLKTFARLLNALNFEKVSTLEAHSNVSLALIDHISNHDCAHLVRQHILENDSHPSPDLLFFPDEGAVKRYSSVLQDLPYLYGMKVRNWADGKITGLTVCGTQTCPTPLTGSSILIVDDICSRGGTFIRAATELRKLGAAAVDLYVSHCENTIYQGELLTACFEDSPLIRWIYTTDSILTRKDSKRIQIIHHFRKGEPIHA